MFLEIPQLPPLALKFLTKKILAKAQNVRYHKTYSGNLPSAGATKKGSQDKACKSPPALVKRVILFVSWLLCTLKIINIDNFPATFCHVQGVSRSSKGIFDD